MRVEGPGQSPPTKGAQSKIVTNNKALTPMSPVSGSSVTQKSKVEVEAQSVNKLRGQAPGSTFNDQAKSALKMQSSIADEALGSPQDKKKKKKSDPPKKGGFGFAAMLRRAREKAQKRREQLPKPDWAKLKPGDKVPAEDGGAGWVAVKRGDNVVLERAGPKDEKGPQWTETYGKGQNDSSYRRELPADDKGPNWTQTKTHNGVVKTSREIEAKDGGPAWTESRDPWGQTTTSRQQKAKDGGNDWTEIRLPDGRTHRRRTVPAKDGGNAWTETVSPEGIRRSRRTVFKPNGDMWSEHKNGKNRWAINETALNKARQSPVQIVKVEGPGGKPVEMRVRGATKEELARIKARLEALPPEMRVHTGEITVSDGIGVMLDSDGKPRSGIAGLGGGGAMTLDRSSIKTDHELDRVLYHEMGHVQDAANGHTSAKPPWGDGNSVTPYGGTNAAEDYAEIHRVALKHHGTFAKSSREAILKGHPQGAKLVQILDSYGFKYGESDTLAHVEGMRPPPGGLGLGALFGGLKIGGSLIGATGQDIQKELDKKGG